MNNYLFWCIVFGISQTFYRNLSWLGAKTSFSTCFCFAVKNSIELRECKVSCSMWLCRWRTLSYIEQPFQKSFWFPQLPDDRLIVSKYRFQIAEFCSFFGSWVQRLKSTVLIPFCEGMTFSGKFFVFGEDQLTLTCFQLWFWDLHKQLSQVLWEITKVYMKFAKERVLLKANFLKIFSKNLYWFYKNPLGLAGNVQ